MSINKRAIISGALGASASLIAKLALAPDSPVPSAVNSFCKNSLLRESIPISAVDDGLQDNDCSVGSLIWMIQPSVCPSLALATRGLCLLCMIGLNAWMISSFLDGMNESGSVVGTSLSTAANFSCSVSRHRKNRLAIIEYYSLGV